MRNNIALSIIIVNYKVEKEIIRCISSIINSKPKVSYEIIVVDNEQNSKLGNLAKQFVQVKYIKSSRNIGYGSGNNLGEKVAKGKYIFFLNPDTEVTNNSIEALYKFMIDNPQAGMVAPILYDQKNNIYAEQGSDAYSLISAVIISSFINKIFPNNPISKKFFHKDWNKKSTEEFDVVPGTAFMIRKDIFHKAGKFDERFFLYFEEYDLAKRIKFLGYKNYIVPKSKILHIWEASTKQRKDINVIFSQSRFLFFKKNYSLLFALVIKFLTGIGKYEIMLAPILLFSIFLGFYKINELMPFIGDQGWFYISARDMLLDGKIPLVGIASSHPWLHQGPLWTYLLALFLWLFKFDPVAGAYPTIIFGVLSVIGIYFLGKSLFNKRVGLIASFLYAASPLVVFYVRFPYHTSPIPFFVIIFIFSLFKIVTNKLFYLPIALFALSVLYNFEIATVVLLPILTGVVLYKMFKSDLNLTKKHIVLSTISFVIPLIPIILYDVKNGFPQTVKFLAWIFYRLFSFGQNTTIESTQNMLNFLGFNFSKLIFPSNNLVTFGILITFAFWILYYFIKKKDKTYKLLLSLFCFPLFVLVLNQTPSDAYLPVVFPTTTLLLALFFDFLMHKFKIITLVLLIFILLTNIYFIFKEDFILDKKSGRLFTLDKRMEASKEIINLASGRNYNLKGLGLGSNHESFTMNYEYLAWWLGHAPSEKEENVKIYVSESAKGIRIND